MPQYTVCLRELPKRRAESGVRGYTQRTWRELKRIAPETSATIGTSTIWIIALFARVVRSDGSKRAVSFPMTPAEKRPPREGEVSLSELGNIDFPGRTTKRGQHPPLQFVLRAPVSTRTTAGYT